MSDSKYNELQKAFKQLLSEYADVYKNVKANNDWKNSFREIIARKIPGLLVEFGDIDAPYTVVGSYGKGRWTEVPWIGIFDTRITSTAQHGVYIVYLLNKDTKELYLTLESAASEVIRPANEEGVTRPFVGIVGKISDQSKIALRARAAEIRSAINDEFFNSDGEIYSGSAGYDAGAIYFKKYSLNDFPSGEDLIADLKRMLEIYIKYYEWTLKQMDLNHPKIWWPSIAEYDPEINKEKWIELLSDNYLFNSTYLGALAAFYNIGGSSSCRALDKLYKRPMGSVRSICTRIAMGVYKAVKCPLPTTGGDNKYWPIMFVGRNAEKVEDGSYIWKLRPELHAALQEFGISNYSWKEEGSIFDTSATEVITRVKKYIENKGFTFERDTVENLYLSLKSKPFVILAGTSGTGKTRLVRLFSEAIGAVYKMVPVRPDWSDSSDLFGYVDLNGRFIPGSLLDFIKDAQDNPDKPHILCLDEMNLARVEYYLSDVISVIETRNIVNGVIVSDPLITNKNFGPDIDAIDSYGEIIFPENLYLVGTVNMDETTFPFSKKVLDRANTIEFNFVDLIPQFELIGNNSLIQQLPNHFLRSNYLLLAQCASEEEYVTQICTELQRINEILQKSNAHVGYRVRDEIVFYLLYNKTAGDLLPHNQALDNEIMQKILPRIQGSSAAIRDMLCSLFTICAVNHNDYPGDSDAEKMRKALADPSNHCKYKKSAEKLELMVRRFEEEGFTSYWI